MSADATTVAWADASGARCGVLRLGVADGSGTALAVVYAEGKPVLTLAEGGSPLAPGDWHDAEVAGLRMTTVREGECWRVQLGDRVDLEVEALAPPARLDPDDHVARAGGMHGSEQLCAVRGTAAGAPVEGLGQRGRQTGDPDWSALGAARTVSVWLGHETAATLIALRPAGALGHECEAVWGALLAPAPQRVAEARISTTWDAAGRQRRAGLELWVDEEDPWPLRAAGEVLCGSSLELGALRLDCAFFTWHMDGRAGLGRYDVLRPS